MIAVRSAYSAAATLWLLVGCRSAGPAKPYEITECRASAASYGGWTAPPEVLARAVGTIGKTLCYGYWELAPQRVEASVKACASKAQTSSSSFQIPEPDGGCTVEVSTAKHGERRWVWVRSTYARGAEVGDQQDIVELRGDSFVEYAHYWQCGQWSEEATKPDGLAKQEGPSAAMRADWASLPEDLRVFFCLGELKARP